MDMDFVILKWIQENLRCGFLDFAMPWIARLGSGGAVWLMAAALMLCARRYRAQGLALLFGLLAGVLTSSALLKPLIARPRPCWLDADMALLVPRPADFSFPSGHALSSALAATVLALTKGKFGLAAIPLAMLIAFSRLYLYVHFPSDVLGGALIGILLGLLSHFASGAIAAKRASGAR